MPCYTPSQASAVFLTVFVITAPTKGQDTITTETTKDILKKCPEKSHHLGDYAGEKGATVWYYLLLTDVLKERKVASVNFTSSAFMNFSPNLHTCENSWHYKGSVVFLIHSLYIFHFHTKNKKWIKFTQRIIWVKFKCCLFLLLLKILQNGISVKESKERTDIRVMEQPKLSESNYRIQTKC